MNYILGDDNKPVAEPDLIKWALWMEAQKTERLFLTRVGAWEVSTVFLGIDHSWHWEPDHTPILFETMIYKEVPERNNNMGREWLDLQLRYATYEQAKKAHELIVGRLATSLRVRQRNIATVKEELIELLADVRI